MGCASSSPLINGGGPGGVVESAKEAATKTANDVLHAGESAIHDVGEHVKEAVQNVTHEIGSVLGGGKKSDKSDHINEADEPKANGHGDGDDPMPNTDYQIIRLKGSKQSSVEEAELAENMKNDLLTKAQSVGDDTDRLADDLMKETEDLLRDAETGIAHHEMTTRITSAEDGTIEILNLEEPEIERILAEGGRAPDSPKATLNSLTVPAPGKDEAAMPLGADEKPDVKEIVSPTPQASVDGESVTSSVGEEHFLNEVLKATPILTPGKTIQRRTANTAPRPPPPSTSRSERMQRFIFKLNSIILSDIEERTGGGGEDGSIVRQLERNPEKVVELLSKSSVDSGDTAADADVADGDGNVTDDTPEREAPAGNGKQRTALNGAGTLRRQHSILVEGDSNVDGPTEGSDELEGDKGRTAAEQDSEQENGQVIQLKDIPPAVRLRALMRFKSFDSFGKESSTDHRNGRRRMKSLDTIDAEDEKDDEPTGEQRDAHEDERTPDAYRDVPYDPEEEERICEELLAELRALERADKADAKAGDANADEDSIDLSTGDDETPQAGSAPKTAWEKLQDFLQRVPKRRNSNYDFFYESDDDTLTTLFKRHKIKQLFHYSDSSSGSSDTM